MAEQDPYREIRPYKDSEVADVVNQLVHNDELVSAIAKYQFPWMAKHLSFLIKPCVRIAMASKLGDVEDIAGFQQLMSGYMEKMIARSTTKLTCRGLDNLDPNESYLFISNHRDIAMDPAFVNWMLYQAGMSTVRIAIGDNLLRKPYVSDLMRLNKSFIVNRSARAPREMMAALTQLSSYIEHSVVKDEESVWIAQREGRAKDGDDRTDPALLKMLHMSQRKQRSFSEMPAHLKIVPVSISYEYDPCDSRKAQELYALASNGSYEKSQYEDINSIVTGITGFKGHVVVSFGEVIGEGFETPEALAAEIDRQILSNYYLHPSNKLAAGEAEGIAQDKANEFEGRLAELNDGVQQILRQMYARPVLNQQALSES
ncbi:MAG: 1-acyl-sn-glycerol-3-phosphate acyltransferase [Pontibacterium sp.]